MVGGSTTNQYIYIYVLTTINHPTKIVIQHGEIGSDSTEKLFHGEDCLAIVKKHGFRR
jgi:hypothetical protein